MVVLDPLSVGIAAKKGGWPDVTIPWVIATSFGESGWDTEAIVNGAAYGDSAHTYYGLMQNSDIHKDRFPLAFPPSEKWKDPVVQMSVANVIYKEQGMTAFSGRPEKSAEAKAKVGVATVIGAQVAKLDIPVLPDFGGISTGGPEATTTEVGGVLGDAIDNIWANALKGAAPVLWIGGGSILVVLGVILLAKSEVLGSVGKVLGK